MNTCRKTDKLNLLAMDYFCYRLAYLQFQAEIKNIVSATFPIDSSIPFPIPIEISKEVFQNLDQKKFVAIDKNCLKLPVYANTKWLLTKLPPNSKLPIENTPVLALILRIDQFLENNTIIQKLFALIAWSEKRTKVMELNWMESSKYRAALDWSLSETREMKLEEAVSVLNSKIERYSQFKDCKGAIYLIPQIFGKNLTGTKTDYPSEVWQQEWYYPNCLFAIKEFQSLLAALKREEPFIHLQYNHDFVNFSNYNLIKEKTAKI